MRLQVVARRGTEPARQARVELLLEYPEGAVAGPTLVTDASGTAHASLPVRTTRADAAVPIVARVTDLAGEFLIRGAFRPVPPQEPDRPTPSGILTVTPTNPGLGERVRVSLTTRRGFEPVRDARVRFLVGLPEGTLTLPEVFTGPEGTASAAFILPATRTGRSILVTARVQEGPLRYEVGGSFQVSSPRPRSTHPHPEQDARLPASATRRIVGSTSSLKYHRTTCEWARRIAVPNRLTFATTLEARVQGFQPCRACRPW
jgi:hypothetical protein